MNALASSTESARPTVAMKRELTTTVSMRIVRAGMLRAADSDLSYSDPVSETVMELRMAPRQEQDQHRLSFHLSIGPATDA